MSVIIGSARIDERGKVSGGTAGDQKQTKKPDYNGEVSLQNFYVHSKGWYILRPKSAEHAKKIATNMETACNNANIGYSQSDRLGVTKYGTATKTKTNCDCSSLVRQCIREAAGKDPGNFTTANEANMLEASGLFEKRLAYKSGTKLYTGDVLVTKTKGHTVIVTSGADRTVSAPVPEGYYPKYTGNETVSIVKALQQLKIDSSYSFRAKIAAKNGITDYSGTAAQNLKLLGLLKEGKLKK